jgi:hypothetical protein
MDPIRYPVLSGNVAMHRVWYFSGDCNLLYSVCITDKLAFFPSLCQAFRVEVSAEGTHLRLGKIVNQDMAVCGSHNEKRMLGAKCITSFR